MRYIFNAFILFVVLLTFMVILFYGVEQKRQKDVLEELALVHVRSHFEKDLSIRSWASQQGGVYVTPTSKTPPNPYLAHLKERDVETLEGKKMTLINPAYMTRQLHEFANLKSETIGHTTSLNPLRKENAPDAWEKKALESFKKLGTREFYEIETIGGKEYMRYMGAFITEKSCIKCHSDAKEGEVRGGIRVSVPLARYDEIAQKKQRYSMQVYFFFWLFGVISLAFAMYYLLVLLRKNHLLIEASEELKSLSQIDPLTKVYNRRVFEEKLSKKWLAYQKRGEQSALLMIDIDFFKEVNDTHGHLAGDEVLLFLAQSVQEHVREEDCFARVGGEEFALLLSETKVRRAFVIAERLRRAIEQSTIAIGGEKKVSITISIGIATFLPDDENKEAIVARSDEAMYEAKRTGRNKVVVAS